MKTNLKVLRVLSKVCYVVDISVSANERVVNNYFGLIWFSFLGKQGKVFTEVARAKALFASTLTLTINIGDGSTSTRTHSLESRLKIQNPIISLSSRYYLTLIAIRQLKSCQVDRGQSLKECSLDAYTAH